MTKKFNDLPAPLLDGRFLIRRAADASQLLVVATDPSEMVVATMQNGAAPG